MSPVLRAEVKNRGQGRILHLFDVPETPGQACPGLRWVMQAADIFFPCRTWSR